MLVSRTGSSDSLNDKRENKNQKNGTAFWGGVVQLFATSLRAYIYFSKGINMLRGFRQWFCACDSHFVCRILFGSAKSRSFKDFERILNQAINPLHSWHASDPNLGSLPSTHHNLGKQVGNLWDPHDASMWRLYIYLAWTVDLYGLDVAKYTMDPMDPMEYIPASQMKSAVLIGVFSPCL